MRLLIALLAAAVLAGSPAPARAEQFGLKFLPDNYFRPIGHKNYHIYDGALFSARHGVDATQNVTVVALITHSGKDGTLLPKAWDRYAADWTPLALGGAFGGRSANFNFGPIFNVAPPVANAAIDLLELVAPDKFANAKSFLRPPQKDGVDLTFSYGFMVNAEILRNGTFLPFNQWWTEPLRPYAGGALHF